MADSVFKLSYSGLSVRQKSSMPTSKCLEHLWPTLLFCGRFYWFVANCIDALPVVPGQAGTHGEARKPRYLLYGSLSGIPAAGTWHGSRLRGDDAMAGGDGGGAIKPGLPAPRPAH